MFNFKIEGGQYTSTNQIVTGKLILEIAGFDQIEDYELRLKKEHGGFDEVEMDQEIDLGSAGIEHFQVKLKKTIEITVDDEIYPVTESFMTPNQIMELAGLKPDDYYLKQIIGKKEISYKENPYDEIAMRNKMRFTTCSKAPATVS